VRGAVTSDDRRRDVEHAAVRVLASAPSLDSAAPRILEGVCDALGWELGALWLLDRGVDELRFADAWTRDDAAYEPFVGACRDRTFEKGTGLPGRVWEVRQPTWIPDVTNDNNFPRAAAARETGLHGAFAFPIQVGANFFGAMEFFSREVCGPDESLLDMASTIGTQIGVFLERTRLAEELKLQTALLRSQSEAAIDGILLVSTDQRVLYWNQHLIEMWGVPEEVLERGDPFEVNEHMADKTADRRFFEEIAKAIREDPILSRRDEIPLADGRVFDRWTAPARTETGNPLGRTVFYRDITEQKRLEERLRTSEQWSAFLAEASSLLAQTFDYETELQGLARLVVPQLADWCVIHVLDEQGEIVPVALEHTDPAKVAGAWRSTERHPVDRTVEVGVAGVISSRTPLLLEEVTDEILQTAARSDEQLAALREAGIVSAIVVPIVARDRGLGSLTLVSAESGRRYTKEDLDRAMELAARAALPIDNARLYQQTAVVAQTLQRSLLPPELPRIRGVDLAARYFPAGEAAQVGGDFYDAFRTGRRSWALVLGDVSGKGIEAATVTALARHTMRAAAMAVDRPSQILKMLNTALLERTDIDRFCTVVYAHVEPRFGRVRVTVSSAGHPVPYIVRSNGTVEAVDCGGTLVGFVEGIALKDAIVDLEFGDKLFLYTDGLLDIRPAEGEFGPEGLVNLLRQTGKRGTETATELIGRTALDLEAGEQRDDIAILALGVKSSIFRLQPRWRQITRPSDDDEADEDETDA
jgi:PAS domain S-box-containing protein